ncbi:uncharacterized protein LOC136039617 [Artemia franciscana]
MEHMSLYELLSWHERERRGNDEKMLLQTGSFFLRRRTQKPYIIQHKKANPLESDEKKEQYYGMLLKLFKPWRNERDILVHDFNNFETYCIESEKYPAMVAYREKLVNKTTCDAEFETRVRQRATEIKVTEMNDLTDGQHEIDDPNNAIQGEIIDRAADAMEDLVNANRQLLESITSEELSNDFHSLNLDQKRIVDRIIGNLKNGSNDKPIRLIVSGFGGTGKSRVISVLRRFICQEFVREECPVVVMAPTGLAAHSIKGVTIHRCLSLPVDQQTTAKYLSLSTEQLLTLRKTLGRTRLFIIDEISMVSSLMLMYIHLRLTEIKSTNFPMGNANFVRFGDFLQLRPVSANPPFIPLTRLEIRNRLGSMGSFNLWHEFEYDELTINMRQKNDKPYADTLANIRLGNCEEHHLQCLSTRKFGCMSRATSEEIIKLYCHLCKEGKVPVILMPTNDDCRLVNNTLLKETSSKHVTLTAIDCLSSVVRNKRIEEEAAKSVSSFADDCKRTAGALTTLVLSIGARVMLQRNIAVDKGLVNGSMGYVKEFKSIPSSEIVSVLVQFDGQDQLTSIGRATVRFEALKEVYYTRKQFPLQLAFAITIHKSQGLSLECAIVDAGSRCFGPGMIYVALSRVTTSAGLHLVELDPSKIIADMEAIIEYNRLRSSYRPDLPLLRIIQTPTTNLNEDVVEIGSIGNIYLKRKKNVEHAIIGKGEKRKPAIEDSFSNKTKSRKTMSITNEVRSNATILPTKGDSVILGIEGNKKRSNQKQLYQRGIGAGRKGFQNRDGVSCYANSAVQCVFSLHRILFDMLQNSQGNVATEILRLAVSSLDKIESTVQLRSLLPTVYGFAEDEQQSLCEFWEALFRSMDEENSETSTTTALSPLSRLFQFTNHKFLACHRCNWSQIDDNMTNGKVCYFPVPGVLNPDVPAHEEVVETSDIQFSEVLSPYPVGKFCPNEHQLTSHTVFTEMPLFLAINLDRSAMAHKITRRIIGFEPDHILLESTMSEVISDVSYNDIVVSLERYRAIAIVVHTGINFNSGHYYVYRRTLEGTWCLWDDSNVKVMGKQAMDCSGCNLEVATTG